MLASSNTGKNQTALRHAANRQMTRQARAAATRYSKKFVHVRVPHAVAVRDGWACPLRPTSAINGGQAAVLERARDPMTPESGNLWVEIVGGIIVARLRGTITQDFIRECQRRIVELQRDTGCQRVLYDALEMDRPPMGTVLQQKELSDAFRQAPISVAIVVPNTGLAYLSRIAFAETNHRVFYNDLASALKWLANE